MHYFKTNIQSSIKQLYLFSLLFLTAISAVFAQNNSSGLAVALTAGKITVNKKNITNDWTIATVLNTLDTASEKMPGNYIKHVFHNLGIVLFERTVNRTTTGELSELQIFIDQTEQTTFTPKEFYEGKLYIEELNISRSTPIATIRAGLKGYKEKEMPENNIYRFSKDGVYILIKYNSGHVLQKVSFGKDKGTSS